jgi:L-iditol 2-dehydrogenase
MKAALLVGPEKYELKDLPEPELTEDGLILRVEACGVCGSDLRRWHEGPPPGVAGIVTGHEVAGVVEKVGAKVTLFKVGDHLALAPDVHCGHCYYCERGLYNLCDNLNLVGITPGYPGGFAEKMLLTGEILLNGIVHAYNPAMSFEAAAFAEPCSSVIAIHDRVGTSIKDTVVVMGGGPIGCLHINVAKSRGAAVILSEPSAARQKAAQSLQPDLIVNPLTQNLLEEVKKFTNGRGADLVICANPVAATQTQAVEIVRKRGKVVLFGGLPKSNPLTSLNGNLIHYNEIEILGSFSYHPTIHAMALDVIERGLIQVDKLITHTLPLDQIGEAFRLAASGDALKVMVKP